jgi:SAM-dependent methyltransferase
MAAAFDSTFSDPLPGRDAPVSEEAQQAWFHDHFDQAAGAVVDFLAEDGISLEGKWVADIGCGDGIIDLGVALRGRPERLHGYDIDPRTDDLLERARRFGVADELPEGLFFHKNEAAFIPCEPDVFDVVFSWSSFEHILQPVPMLQEIRRIMKPSGVFMLQLWPFYHSQHGAHLWHHFPEGFTAQRYSDEEIEARLRADETADPAWIEGRIVDYKTLNRITLDELHRCLLAARLTVAKVELITTPVHLTPELQRFPLSQLVIGGVKLLAVPS